MKPIRLQNGIELASLDATSARVRMLNPLTAANVRPDEDLAARLKAAGIASQWSVNQKNDTFEFTKVEDVLPRDGDYIAVDFRAISKTIVPGHWIDWTRDGVLEASVPRLLGATVYPNHDYYDINGWLGAVSNVEWDAKGTAADGVPGINARYKIDALMNPRIARGLMMDPPAIHSTSMTVLFEFEYSHPDMAAEDRWKFFKNLGEEIDGEIVRLIVTKINEYWEASLVFQGADRLAKLRRSSGTESFSADEAEEAAETPPNSNEEKTMKLTSELKAQLGIEFDGDEVPDDQVVAAVDALSAQAAKVPANLAELEARALAGDALVAEKRADVLRLAKLAEASGEDDELDPVVVDSINEADVERLQKLGAYYQKRVADKFPKGGRSSLENSDEIDNAGGVANPNGKALPEAGLL
ncbi:MAG: hypothetical protein IPM50_02650 [Acidobacteriota bacterium]|nr:MAG: hypothetical protein IPM50_02650 [Acidobacteriota bacterium]